ncbi:SMC-Scp complex subunit ScpB [Candidatus Woesearchaeota archaeon CG10_big_fil_rev_8_21_14_0_10_34_12]|nr:MAG: SMC-Scp complex subunit ScpB [Candidatus Woesearchaeota archaeon CG10_big_fil_rev_8_21_14_0_10_34_12]
MEIEKEDSISSQAIEELESSEEHLKKIEAALFIAGKFLTLQELIMLTDLNPLLIREVIEKLMEKYNNESSAIEIIKKEDSWKMDVKPDYTYMINKLATGSAEFSKAEQETLAIIAYKQPIKQSVIIKIRGNKAYDHIKNFINLGLIKAKKQGHTFDLNLSDEFYSYFSLQNGKLDKKEEQ